MPNLLVVEDEAGTREAYTRALEIAGFRVRAVANGRAALDALLGEPVDLVVLDLFMPVMDGFAFLEVIRSYVRWRDLPVVVVTARATHEDDLAERLTVSRVFHKAKFHLNELIACARQLVPPPSPN